MTTLATEIKIKQNKKAVVHFPLCRFIYFIRLPEYDIDNTQSVKFDKKKKAKA